MHQTRASDAAGRWDGIGRHAAWLAGQARLASADFQDKRQLSSSNRIFAYCKGSVKISAASLPRSGHIVSAAGRAFSGKDSTSTAIYRKLHDGIQSGNGLQAATVLLEGVCSLGVEEENVSGRDCF